mgnify:CR=1 FL=1
MKRDNLSKNYLLKKIYYRLGIPHSFSKKILNYFLDIIIIGLIRDDKVKITGFGTFKILKKKSRIGRNPKTKESKVISSRDVVLFKPSKEFKALVNLKDNG